MKNAPISTGPSDMELALLIEEATGKLQAGEPLDLDAYARDFPDQIDQLCDILPALEALAGIEGGDDLREDAGVGMDLGDFRIVREIGRGGMGIVYEAEQLSMGRLVALKILPLAAMIDPKGLARFKNEVRAVATLDHRNIVPVYSVGEERGVHYFAMRLIQGQSISCVIRQLQRADPQFGASSIAAAVDDWAERSGGPHGDREPAAPSDAVAAVELADASTLVAHDGETVPESKSRRSDFYRSVAKLGVQAADALHHAHQHGIVHRDVKPGNLLVDGRGNLWVTDFGLARIEADAGLTLSRDWVGTLRYMAPEQALGKKTRVDHRVDVYSLGATLYELLVLRPAREGEDRDEMLRHFATLLPTPLRKVDSKIPRELATIVEKAMEFEPADRYSTAQELADDLGRFLDNQPIVARPPTRLQRIAKWAQRNRAVTWSAAISSAAVLILAVMLLAINNVMITKERNQKDVALRDKKEALVEKEEALLEKDEALVEKEASLHIATQVLNQVYLRIVALRMPQQDSDGMSGEEWLRTTGHYPSTEPLTAEEQRILEQVLRFYEQLAEQSGQDPQVRFTRAQAYDRIAGIYSSLDRTDDADEAQRQAVVLLEQLVRDGPESSDHRLWLYRSRARLHADQKQWRAAIEDFSLALEISPEDIPSRINRGRAYEMSGQLEKAVEDFSQAIELRPNHALARCNRGNAHNKLNQWEKAIPDFVRAIAINPGYSASWGGRGYAYLGMGQLETAISDLTREIELNPNTHNAYLNRGTAYRQLGQLDKAFADFSRTVELDPKMAKAWYNRGIVDLLRREWQMGIDDCSRVIELQPDHAEAHVNRGFAYKKLDQTEKAIEDLSRAIELNPQEENAWVNRGGCYARQGELEKALEDFSRLIELEPGKARGWISRAGIYERLKQLDAAIGDLSQAIALEPENAKTWFRRGMLFFGLGEWRSAGDDFSQVVSLDPDGELGWHFLGSTQYRAGDYRSAIDALGKAEEFSGESFAASAFLLAMAHWQLDEKEVARQWYQKGVERMKNDATPTPQLMHLHAEAEALMATKSPE